MAETQDTARAEGPDLTPPTHRPAAPREGSGAESGWVVFAGTIMILAGVFQVIEGLVALVNRHFYLVTSNGLVINVNYTTWGLVHLIVGGIAILTGIGVLAGLAAARVVGIVLAAISAFVNLGFLAAYPLWATIIITLDVIVIYALAVHGREVPGQPAPA